MLGLRVKKRVFCVKISVRKLLKKDLIGFLFIIIINVGFFRSVNLLWIFKIIEIM